MSRTSNNQAQRGQPRHRRHHHHGEHPLPYKPYRQHGMEVDNSESDVGSEQEAVGVADTHVKEPCTVEEPQSVESRFENNQTNGFGHHHDATRVEPVAYGWQAQHAGHGAYPGQGQHRNSQYDAHDGYAGQSQHQYSQYGAHDVYAGQSLASQRSSSPSQDSAGEHHSGTYRAAGRVTRSISVPGWNETTYNVAYDRGSRDIARLRHSMADVDRLGLSNTLPVGEENSH